MHGIKNGNQQDLSWSFWFIQKLSIYKCNYQKGKINPSKMQPKAADRDSCFHHHTFFLVSRCSEILTSLSGEALQEARWSMAQQDCQISLYRFSSFLLLEQFCSSLSEKTTLMGIWWTGKCCSLLISSSFYKRWKSCCYNLDQLVSIRQKMFV